MTAPNTAPTSRPMEPAAGPAKKPLRFTIGVILLGLMVVLYLAAGVTLLLPLTAGTKAAAVGATVVAAETCSLLGIAGVGKEALEATKRRLFRRNGGVA